MHINGAINMQYTYFKPIDLHYIRLSKEGFICQYTFFIMHVFKLDREGGDIYLPQKFIN